MSDTATRRKLRGFLLVLAVMLGAVLTGVAHVSFAVERFSGEPGDAPGGGQSQDGIDPPGGSLQVATLDVQRGVQIYECANGTFTGAGSIPKARLVGPAGTVRHFEGPSWQFQDGSTVTATVLSDSPAEGDAIPLLLLEVNGRSGPEGVFSTVTHIQRLNTSGGVAPSDSCNDGETVRVPYGATYVFWSASSGEPGDAPGGGQSQDGIDPPGGSQQVATLDVQRGVQIYECANGTFTGAGSIPKARLVGPAGTVRHFGGPSWQFQDGSTVTATVLSDSPAGGDAIPLLLLEVNGRSGPEGLFSTVTHIQRLNTSGGVAPSDSCNDGETVRVPYGATYVFWSAS